jgi:hypothetical protein
MTPIIVHGIHTNDHHHEDLSIAYDYTLPNGRIYFEN